MPQLIVLVSSFRIQYRHYVWVLFLFCEQHMTVVAVILRSASRSAVRIFLV